MHKVALRETPHRGRAGGRTEGASLTIHASRIDSTSHRHSSTGREEDNSQRSKESTKTHVLYTLAGMASHPRMRDPDQRQVRSPVGFEGDP